MTTRKLLTGTENLDIDPIKGLRMRVKSRYVPYWDPDAYEPDVGGYVQKMPEYLKEIRFALLNPELAAQRGYQPFYRRPTFAQPPGVGTYLMGETATEEKRRATEEERWEEAYRRAGPDVGTYEQYRQAMATGQTEAMRQREEELTQLAYPEKYGGSAPSLEEYPEGYQPKWMTERPGGQAYLASLPGGGQIDTSKMSNYEGYGTVFDEWGTGNPFYEAGIAEFGRGNLPSPRRTDFYKPPAPEPTYFATEKEYSDYLFSKGFRGDVSGLYAEYKAALPPSRQIRSIAPVTEDIRKQFPSLKIGDLFATLDTGEVLPVTQAEEAAWTGELPSEEELRTLPAGATYLGRRDGTSSWLEPQWVIENIVHPQAPEKELVKKGEELAWEYEPGTGQFIQEPRTGEIVFTGGRLRAVPLSQLEAERRRKEFYEEYQNIETGKVRSYDDFIKNVEEVIQFLKTDPARINAFIADIVQAGEGKETDLLLHLLGLKTPAEIGDFWAEVETAKYRIPGVPVSEKSPFAEDEARRQVTMGPLEIPYRSEEERQEVESQKSLWNTFYGALRGAQHKTAQFVRFYLSQLPEPRFATPQAQERERQQKEIYAQQYTAHKVEFEDWVKKHPEVQPPTEITAFREQVGKLPFFEQLGRYIANPQAMAYTIAEVAPPTIAALGAFATVTALTKNPLAGMAASFGVFAPMTIQDVAEDLINAGAPEERAAQLALPVGALIASLDIVGELPLLKALSPVLGALSKGLQKELVERTVARMVKKGLTTFALNEFTETFTEVAQQVIQDYTVSFFDKERNPFENINQVAVQTLVATLPYSIFGGAISVRGSLVNSYNQDVARFKAEGLSDEEAKVQALNEAARTPEGASLIKKAYDQIVRTGKAIITEERGAIEIPGKEPWQMTQATFYDTNTRFADDLTKLRNIEAQIQDIERLGEQRRIDIAIRIPKGEQEIKLAKEWTELNKTTTAKIRAIEATNHERIVEQALREGKPVPPEVLKDYPDLAKAAEVPTKFGVTVPTKPQMTDAEVEALFAKQFPKAPITPKVTLPKAEAGMPAKTWTEAGLQPSMIPEEVAAKEVRPVGKGKVTQISMDEYNRLVGLRQEAQAEISRAEQEAIGLKETLATDPVATARFKIGGKNVGLDHFISLKEGTFPDYFTVKEAQALRPNYTFKMLTKKGRVPRDAALDELGSKWGMTPDEIADRAMQIRKEKGRVSELEARIRTTEIPEVPAPPAKAIKPPIKPYSEQEIANFRMVQEQQARQMADAGTSSSEIAKELKVSEAYVKELLSKPPGIEAPLVEKGIPAVTEGAIVPPKPPVPPVTGRGGLTPAQNDETIRLFGKYVTNPTTESAWEVTRALRRETLSTKAEHLKAAAQEFIAKGESPEEALNKAITQAMSGELPALTTNYFDDLTREMRDVLFARVYNTLKDEPFEMLSTVEALTNALLGKPIPRELGVKGGSAWTRLNRVFGEEPQVMKALEKIADEKKPLRDIIEGIFRVPGQPPTPLDEAIVEYLRKLQDTLVHEPAMFTGADLHVTDPRTLGEKAGAFERMKAEYDLAMVKLSKPSDLPPFEEWNPETLHLYIQGGAKEVTPTAPELLLSFKDTRTAAERALDLETFETEIAGKARGLSGVQYEAPIEDAIKELRLPGDPWDRPVMDKIVRVLKEIGLSPMDIGGFIKANKSSFDMSYWRQITPLIAGHLNRFALSNVEAWKALFSQASAEASWLRIIHDPEERQLYSIYDALQAKQGRDFLRPFDLPKGTQQFKGVEEFGYLTSERLIPRITARIPWVKWSNRAFITGTNSMSWGVFKDFYRMQLRVAEKYASGALKLKLGQTFDITAAMDAEATKLADWTGRASLGKLAPAAPAIANILYAPRYALGRLIGPRHLFSANPYVRKEAWKDAVMFVGSIGGLLLLGRALDFWEVETDRNSADFMKIRIGNKHIDPWGGAQQFVVFFSRVVDLVMAPITGKPAMGKSSVTGAEYPLRFTNLLENLLESKAAPLVALINQYMTGKTYGGEKVDVKNVKQWADRIGPMSLMDIWDALEEGPVGTVMAGGLSFLGFGVQTYTGDWKENIPKTGLPKYSDNVPYGMTEPVYDVKDLWSDTASQFKGVDPKTLTEAKGFPRMIQAMAEAKQILDSMEKIPNQKLTSINADPKLGTTFMGYYQMWRDRQALVAKGDEKALAEFDKDERTKNAHFGNISQTQYTLLWQYHNLTDKKQQAQFLKDHPELDQNPREEFLRSHPDDNAKLAVWGQAKVLTQAAYDKAISLAKELDIPMGALADYLLPKEIAKSYFELQDAADKFGDSYEVDLILANNPELGRWLGRKAIETPIPALELKVKNREIQDKYNDLGDKESASYIYDPKARETAREKLKADNPKWVDDLRRIQAYEKKATDTKVIESYVEYGKLVDKFEANSAEAKLYRFDNPDLERWGQDNLDWTPVNVKSADALRLQVKNRDLTTQYNAIRGATLPQEQKLQEAFLKANPEFAQDRLRIEGFNKGLTGTVVDQYVEYQGKQRTGGFKTEYDDDWYLLAHPELYRAMTTLEDSPWAKRDFSKVPTREVYGLYQVYLKLPDRQTARYAFRRAYPNLDAWMIVKGLVKPMRVTQPSRAEVEVSRWRARQPVTRQPVARVILPRRVRQPSPARTLKRVGVLR